MLDVPNKTIYVSDGDLPLYQRAQELAGGNLSAAIAAALRRYVDVEEGRREGFDEITVRVGVGPKGRKVRFTGVLLGEWVNITAESRSTASIAAGRASSSSTSSAARTGRWSTRRASRPAGAATSASATSATGAARRASRPSRSSRPVDELREKIPPELYDMVAGRGQAAGGRGPRHLGLAGSGRSDMTADPGPARDPRCAGCASRTASTSSSTASTSRSRRGRSSRCSARTAPARRRWSTSCRR